MKITFIIATLNSGGAERVLVTLANYFCKFHEVSIIKFHEQNSFYKVNEKIKIITLKQFKFNNLYNKIASRFKKYFALRKALKEQNADVFISFLDTTNIICIMAKIGLKTPLIISEHSNEIYLKNKIFRFLRRFTYPYADALTILTKSDENYYKNFVKNIIYLQNPCNFTLQNLDYKKENLVIFVGRLDENKNALMFLKAINNLDENIKNTYKFQIAGDGDLKEKLSQEAKNLNIKVDFLGKVNDIEELYKKAKIICLCSFVEGLPTILIESMYFKVARISTNYCNNANELINNEKDGFIINLNDDKELAQKITLLASDENLREKITNEALLRTKDYDIKNIYEKWINLINTLKAKN